MATYTARMSTNLAINTIIELVLTQGTQSVANNRTPFTYTIKIRKVNNWNDNFIGNADVTFTMGGTSVVSITNKWWSIHSDTATEEYTLASGSFNVNHDSDGKKTAAIYVRVDPNVSNGGVDWGTAEVMTINESLTLPQIPRATTITSVGNIDSNATYLSLNLSKKLSSYIHYISLKIGSTFIAEWNRTALANQDGARNLPLDDIHRERIKQGMPSSVTVIGVVNVNTYNGSALIGSTSRTLTITIASSEYPTFPTFTQTPKTHFNLSNTDKAVLVQQVGKLAYQTVPAAPYGTSIKTFYNTFCGARNSAQSGSFIATKPGTQRFQSFVTDRRGCGNSYYRDYQVIPYTSPTLQLAYCGRPRDQNTAKHYGQFEVNINVSSVMSGTTELNKFNLMIEVKEKGTTDWATIHTEEYTITGQYTRTYTPSYILDETKAYDVQIILQDEFRTVVALSEIGTANYLMALGKYGVGFGKLPEGRRVLDVGGDIWDRSGRNLSETVQNLNLALQPVKTTKTLYGDGANPYIIAKIAIPDGCAADAAIVNFQSNAPVFLYAQSQEGQNLKLSFWQDGRQPISTSDWIDVSVFFRKLF